MHSKHHINARLGDPTAAAATITHRNRRFKNEISDSGILCELGDDVKCTIRVGDASRVKNVRRTHSKGNSRVFTSVLKSHLPKNDGGEEYQSRRRFVEYTLLHGLRHQCIVLSLPPNGLPVFKNQI